MALEGKRIVVTGGSSGIGQAAAVRVAKEGARTATLDVREGEGPTTLERIRADGGQARYFSADVSREEEVATAIDAAARWLGGGIDAVVHSAGIMKGQGVDLRSMDVDVWHRVLSVNLTGAFYVAKHVARYMIPARSGVIVLVASVGGVITGSGSYAYGASKGGVHGLALTLDLHLAQHGIRVHELCPDGIDTPLFRASVEEGLSQGVDPRTYDSDLGTPGDLADMLAFLLSDNARYAPLTIVARPRVASPRVDPAP